MMQRCGSDRGEDDQPQRVSGWPIQAGPQPLAC
jgi:hypothetical protein